MGEWRLVHVEASFEVPTWLARTLPQCERALLRGKGPKSKAAKLRLQDLVSDAESLRGDFLPDLHWPFRKYVLAIRWLFRDVEGHGARLAHASISQDVRVASSSPPWCPRRRSAATVSFRSCCPAGFGPGQHLAGPHVVITDRGGRGRPGSLRRWRQRGVGSCFRWSAARRRRRARW